jgi:hypothetical protein
MVTLALTAVLVLVTAYYAWQSHRMVAEMQRARRTRHDPPCGGVRPCRAACGARQHLRDERGRGTALDIGLAPAPNGSHQTHLPDAQGGERRMWSQRSTAARGRGPVLSDSAPAGLTHLTGRCDVDGVRHEVDEITPLRDA